MSPVEVQVMMEKLIDAFWKISAAVGLLALGLLAGLSRRVSLIESNRFTNGDASAMEQRIESRQREILNQLTRIEDAR